MPQPRKPGVTAGREGLGVAPGIVAVADGRVLSACTRYRTDGSSMTLWSRRLPGGKTGLWSNTSMEPDEFQSVLEPVTARCAIATATGFLVMTDDGPLTLTEQEDDGTLTTASRISGIAPKITIEGVAMGELSATLPAMTMSNVDFSRVSPQLRQSDIKTLSGHLADALHDARGNGCRRRNVASTGSCPMASGFGSRRTHLQLQSDSDSPGRMAVLQRDQRGMQQKRQRSECSIDTHDGHGLPHPPDH